MGDTFPKCKFCGEHHRLGPAWCPSLSSGGGGSSKPAPVMSADPHRDRVRSAPPQGTNHRIGKAGVAPSPPEPLKQLLKKGRPRLGEIRPKPWIEAGMSERTWYRRQKEKIGGTNPS